MAVCCLGYMNFTELIIFQCPSVEPELALYVRVCESCLSKLKTRQFDKVEQEEKMLDKGGYSLELLIKLHTTMHKNEMKMEDQLREVHCTQIIKKD